MLNYLKFAYRFLKYPKRNNLLQSAIFKNFSTNQTKITIDMESPATSPILSHKIDRYQAATIDPISLPSDKETFDKMLEATLAHFREVNVRGIWLRLELDKSLLIPIALKHGFKYHHAKKNYLLLQHWLPKDEISKLPHYATHFIGVGGAVINEETDEILVIQERVAQIENLWKIPGGLVDESEYISEAAVREVWEETGIKAEFQSILAWRERKDYIWGQADIYFVALMKPLTTEITIDPLEIKVAKWMKIDEYLNTMNMYDLQRRIASAIGKTRKTGIEKIKSLGPDALIDLISFSSDEYTAKIGDHEQQMVPGNIFYSPSILKKLTPGNEKL